MPRKGLQSTDHFHGPENNKVIATLESKRFG